MEILHAYQNGNLNRWFTFFGRTMFQPLAFCLSFAFPVAIFPSQLDANSVMQVGPVIHAPFGFLEFCRRNSNECHEKTSEPVTVHLSPERQTELENVQSAVNYRVFYTPDRRNYRKNEYWAYPFIYGDCEDYALEKRRRLIALGWPPSALLLAVVIMRNKRRHAVLVVTTSAGDFVLDNAKKETYLWHQSDYRWISRQSRSNELIWVSIGPPPPL